MSFLILVAATLGSSSPGPDADPAQNLARVRVIVVTTAATTDVTVSGATILSYISSVLAGPDGARTSRTGQTLRLSQNSPGQSAEAQFDAILGSVPSDGTLAWNLATSSNVETSLELYSLADLNHPRLVDRFTATGAGGQFTSHSTLFGPDQQLHVSLVPRLVLAAYYPWYTLDTWNNPQLIDRPLRPYSNDSQADVNLIASQASAAGIDVFAVSWQGKDIGGGWNDRRMRIVLDAAAAAGMQACVLVEMAVVNPTNDPNAPPDPQTMLEYLSDIVDLYGKHPAYLRVGNQPVILVLAATKFRPSDWSSLLTRLRATGRNPLVIGEMFQAPQLEQLDGEYQYSHVTLSPSDILDVDRTESGRVRTYNLLRQGDRRRIWVAVVSPGYDDRRIVGRPTPFVLDRANGARYGDEWTAAVRTAADWIIVTTWNEWWENTEIEPSVRYGRTFLDLSRGWANLFKGPDSSTRKLPTRTQLRNRVS